MCCLLGSRQAPKFGNVSPKVSRITRVTERMPLTDAVDAIGQSSAEKGKARELGNGDELNGTRVGISVDYTVLTARV